MSLSCNVRSVVLSLASGVVDPPSVAKLFRGTIGEQIWVFGDSFNPLLSMGALSV